MTSTKTAHTPGPWHVTRGLYGEEDGHTVWGPKNGGGGFPKVCDVDGVYNRAADARLIAAAPDLLKLLQEVLEWNEDDADLATNDTAFRLKNFADTVSNRSAALRAIIAKATGGA